jgi:hypothetical protein
MDDPAGLAALVARRLAHDLAGPMAALQTLAGMREADPLETQALAELTGRLALFRGLFGGTGSALPDLAALLPLLAAQLGEGIVLAPRLDPEAPPAATRAALLIGLHAARSAAAGATLGIAADREGRILVTVDPARETALASHAPASQVRGAESAPLRFAEALAGPVRAAPAGSMLRLAAGPA